MREIVAKLIENHRLDEMAALPVSDYLYNKSKFIVYLKEECTNLLLSDTGTDGTRYDIHNSNDIRSTLGVKILKASGDFRVTRYYKGENKDQVIPLNDLYKELDDFNNLSKSATP